MPTVKCKYCDNPFHVKPYLLKIGSGKYCSKHCYTENMKGPNHLRWKGGKTKSGKYIKTLTPNHPRGDKDSYVWEHVIVAEKALGRFLIKKECIHHINEITIDNKLKNLYLFESSGLHSSYHFAVKRGDCKKIIKSNLKYL